MKKIGLFVNGHKGFSVLEAIKDNLDISFVVVSNKEEEEKFGVKLLDRMDVTPDLFESVDFVFCLGWTFLIHNPPDNMIVLHDSPLPKYRGFCPTVAALINAEKEIGVTAFRAIEEIDAGPVCAQKTKKVVYPIKVKEAYSKLINLYCEVIEEVINAEGLTFTEQRHAEATYCLWRDRLDYNINWSDSNFNIRNFVDAVGEPYDGAATTYDGSEITIDDVELVTIDLKFVDRQPGKIWSIKNNKPEIVCGEGMLRILSARHRDSGFPVQFNKLRKRLV